MHALRVSVDLLMAVVDSVTSHAIQASMHWKESMRHIYSLQIQCLTTGRVPATAFHFITSSHHQLDTSITLHVVERAHVLQVARYGLDAGAMSQEAGAAGCATRVVLLPFGSDKDDLEEYQVQITLR